jgi:23S rRNA (uracil1939-C5)-methyltransferase
MDQSPNADQEIFETSIEKLITGGAGLGRLEGRAAFVPLTAPGDRVRARVVRSRKSFVEAELVELLDAGPDRREAPCPHFGACGGCDWQHLDDAVQRATKREIVVDCFRRLGQLDVSGLAAGPDPAGPALGYRNKIRLLGSPTGLYGLHRRQSQTVVPVETCPQMPTRFDEIILPWLRQVPPMEQIVMRHDGEDRWLVLCYGQPNRQRILRKMLGELPPEAPPFPGCTGITFNNMPQWGRDYLVVTVAGHKYRVGALSFFQANLAEASAVVDTVRAWLDDEGPQDGGRFLADLYAGVGLFSLALADRFERVIAVESDPGAVRDARNNVQRDAAARDRVEILEGAVERTLPAPSHADASAWREGCVVLDPPRRGLGKEAAAALCGLRPRHVFYLGCDPATQARDCALLVGAGYEIARLRVFDMFPQTAHIETLVHLKRRALP